MSKKFSNILAQALLASTVMFTACGTDMELCGKTEHPHSGQVSFMYDWRTYTNLPDSMYLVSYRSTNSFKSALVLCADSNKVAVGRFLFNRPVFTSSIVTPTDTTVNDSVVVDEGLLDGEVAEAKTRAAEQSDVWDGLMKTGIYKFISFNVDTAQVVCNSITDFVTDNAESDDLWVEYKTVTKDAEVLDSLMPEWKDYNAYSDYVLPWLNPIYYTAQRKLVSEGVNEVIFMPSRVTQLLNIRFNISKSGSKKVPFVVDSVKAEISGVPTRINIANGYMDISKTQKMLLDVDFIDAKGNTIDEDGIEISDSAKSTYLRCQSKINVPTIVNAESSAMTTGPGIMQLIIYTHLEGQAKSNVIQTKINLYNTLRKANLYTYVDEHRYVKRRIGGTTLSISANLTIDGKKLSENGDNSGGLDQWTSEGGDIDIEI